MVSKEILNKLNKDTSGKLDDTFTILNEQEIKYTCKICDREFDVNGDINIYYKICHECAEKAFTVDLAKKYISSSYELLIEFLEWFYEIDLKNNENIADIIFKYFLEDYNIGYDDRKLKEFCLEWKDIEYWIVFLNEQEKAAYIIEVENKCLEGLE